MRFIVSLLLFLIMGKTEAQVRLASLSLTDTSKAILYIGVDNKIALITPSGKTNTYSIAIKGSGDPIVHNLGNGNYLLKV